MSTSRQMVKNRVQNVSKSVKIDHFWNIQIKKLGIYVGKWSKNMVQNLSFLTKSAIKYSQIIKFKDFKFFKKI